MTKSKFKYNQFIVKKAREIGSDNVNYGIFKVAPYVRYDVEGKPIEFEITYKVHLIPVGKNAEKFCEDDYYTSDLWDIPKERIFDNINLAQNFVNEQ